MDQYYTLNIAPLFFDVTDMIRSLFLYFHLYSPTKRKNTTEDTTLINRNRRILSHSVNLENILFLLSFLYAIYL